ncbi:hypothetical protein EMCRGX_G032150 [Ephydatia muelleri]
MVWAAIKNPIAASPASTMVELGNKIQEAKDAVPESQDDILSQENKAKARARYKADPEKKKASVRYSYNADIESKQSAKRQRYQVDLDENRAAKRQRYQEDVEDNRAAKRNRYWNDPAVRLAKRAAERKRYRRGHRTTTTTQRCSAAPLPSAASSSSAAPTATSSRAALTATSSRAALTATSSRAALTTTSSRAALTATSSRAALTVNSSSRSSRSTATVLVPVPPPPLPWPEPGCRGITGERQYLQRNHGSKTRRHPRDSINDDDGTRSRPEWRAQRDRVIITLLCLKLKTNVTGYCVRETKVTNVSTCSSADVATSCENGTTRCACTSFHMYVYNTLADAVLASSTLVTALEDDGSKLALNVAGFQIISFVASYSAAVPLFNAPLQAWVLVGVGVLVAILYGTKPLWWNRCLWRHSKDEDGTQEPAPKHPGKHQQEEL